MEALVHVKSPASLQSKHTLPFSPVPRTAECLTTLVLVTRRARSLGASHSMQVMQRTSKSRPAAVLMILLQLSFDVMATAEKKDITFVDVSWKEYISKDHDPAWTKGKDALAEAG